MLVVVPIVLMVIIQPFITNIFPESAWAYGIQYSTQSQYVVIDSKPHDCDFFKAPIGNKYCHFDREVAALKDNQHPNQPLVYVSWNKVSE